MSGAVVGRPDYWSERYAAGNHPWELGTPAPVLKGLLERERPAGRRAVVPGCGRGHDVRLLAANGFEARGIDFSARAIDEARGLGEPAGASFELGDVFAMGAAHRGSFDLAWEYTCYCAIDPARRGEYLDAVRDALAPGGLFWALLFPIWTKEGGPPFPVRPGEVEELFAPRFEILGVGEPADSVGPRRGAELLVRARRPQ